jgi:hypothetical protein
VGDGSRRRPGRRAAHGLGDGGRPTREARRLLVCGPADTRRHAARHLVFTGGTRPATAAELGLAGDRPAGVLPITVARHLLQASPALWRRAAIIGVGPGAAEAAAAITAAGGAAIYVGDRAPAPEWAGEAWAGWTPEAIVGRTRVSALRIARAGETELASPARAPA